MAAVLAVAASSQAHAQIFVSSFDGQSISEYNLNGTVENSSFIVSGQNGASLSGPQDMTISNGDLFVANEQGNTIGEYNASTGATINASLISSGLGNPNPLLVSSGTTLFVGDEDGGIGAFNLSTQSFTSGFISRSATGSAQGLALSGNTLYELNGVSGAINTFNATTGQTIANTLHGVGGTANGLVLAGGNLFVTTSSAIDEINLTSGAKSTLVSGLTNAFAISSDGTDLFVTESTSATDPTTGFVAEYSLGGAKLNGSLIPSFFSPDGILVEAVPEPSSWSLGLVAFGAVVVLLRRRRAMLS
jgi:sugar lactone lactonase YvrE